MHRACKVIHNQNRAKNDTEAIAFYDAVVLCVAWRTRRMESDMENTSRVRRIKRKTNLSILWSNPFSRKHLACRLEFLDSNSPDGFKGVAALGLAGGHTSSLLRIYLFMQGRDRGFPGHTFFM